MKRILVLFAILYGQMTGFVLTLSFVLYFSSEPDGERVCTSLGMSLGTCRASVSLLLLLAFGASAVLSISRLRKKSAGDEGSSD